MSLNSCKIYIEIMVISDSEISILTQLSNRGNYSINNIGDKVGLSQKTLRKKIIDLRKRNVIKSWKITINPLVYSESRLYLLYLKTNPNEPEIRDKLIIKSQLLSLEGILGDYSLLGSFRFNSTEEMISSLDEIFSVVGSSSFQRYNLVEILKIEKYSAKQIYQTNYHLSKTDHSLLQKINELGKQTIFPPKITQLAEKCGLSRPSIYRKLREWESEGVILNYSIDSNSINESSIVTYLRVKVLPEHHSNFLKFGLANDDIIHIFRTNQEYSFLLKTSQRSIQDLDQFLKSLYTETEVIDTITTIVIDNIK